jgi:hypothetical protein
MTDQLLQMYSDYAKVEVDAFYDSLYVGVSILDFFIRKQTILKFGDLKKGTLTLPTFVDATRKIFIDSNYALDSTTAETDVWATPGNKKRTRSIDVKGKSGVIIPAHLDLSIITNIDRMNQIATLERSQNFAELKDAIGSDLSKPLADIKWGLAKGVYSGKGGVNSNYADIFTYSAPSYVPGGNVSTTGTAFTANANGDREIEGLHSHWLNASSTNYAPGHTRLANILLSDVPLWKANLYNFFIGNTGSSGKLDDAPFGYDTTAFYTAIVASAKLKSSVLAAATYSRTANVPVIIDILSQVISDLHINGRSPEVGICYRPLFNLIVRALKSVKWGNGIQGQENIDDLLAMGYTEGIKIDGIPIIPDDTFRKNETTGVKTYACPSDAVFFLGLKKFTFKAHKDYNFNVDSKWLSVPDYVRTFHKDIEATVMMSLPDVENQGLVQFATIDYSL